MNNPKPLNPQQVENALGTVRRQLREIGEKYAAAAEGAERAAVAAEHKTLIESLGMEYAGPPGLKEEPAGVGANYLAGMEKVDVKVEAKPGETTVTINQPVGEETTAAEPLKLSMWQRFKNCYANNRKKFWAGFATVIGAIGGMYYYYTQVRNPSGVSSVSATVEVVAPEVPDGGNAGSIFTRMGEWVYNAAKASKDFVVVNAQRFTGWVKNLFTKTPEGDVNVTVETPAVPA